MLWSSAVIRPYAATICGSERLRISVVLPRVWKFVSSHLDPLVVRSPSKASSGGWMPGDEPPGLVTDTTVRGIVALAL